MKRMLIIVTMLLSLALIAATLSQVGRSALATVSYAAQKSGRKSAQKTRRPVQAVSAISNGVRISAISIEAVGQSWGDSENATIEAGAGEEILVVLVSFRSTPALRGKAEVEFPRPALFLDEGHTGRTNLSGFKLFHYQRQPLNQEMEIPFVVPDGAEPQALTVGNAALDLTELEVQEQASESPTPESPQEILRRQHEWDRTRRIREQAEEDRRLRESLKPIRVPTPYPLTITERPPKFIPLPAASPPPQ